MDAQTRFNQWARSASANCWPMASLLNLAIVCWSLSESIIALLICLLLDIHVVTVPLALHTGRAE